MYQKAHHAANDPTFCVRLRQKQWTDHMTRLITALVFLFLCASTLFSQQSKTPAPNPCAVPEQQQLDFWVGEWDLTWPGQNAGEVGHGTNNIKRILDGCVVQENFSGGDSMHLHGTSVSIFDTRTGTWKQTWVDNEGGYLDFVGEFKNGQMILQRAATRPDGTKTLQRMVWKNITANTLDWSWESSLDGGKTWQVNWPIHYKRKG
ncbi:MAG TPA: hypothetical protein VFE61_06190 [Candidatus Sulfotelmatobacter sp.]|nr:hypothetical protein [Candidatus Sulfotelmatobacter sp.]